MSEHNSWALVVSSTTWELMVFRLAAEPCHRTPSLPFYSSNPSLFEFLSLKMSICKFCTSLLFEVIKIPSNFGREIDVQRWTSGHRVLQLHWLLAAGELNQDREPLLRVTAVGGCGIKCFHLPNHY